MSLVDKKKPQCCGGITVLSKLLQMQAPRFMYKLSLRIQFRLRNYILALLVNLNALLGGLYGQFRAPTDC